MNVVDRLRFVQRLLRPTEVAQVKRFGRSALSVLFGTPVLVLATTGRRSGRRHETTLAYLRLDDGQLLVVGGAAGQTRIPDWVANLRADPSVTVTVDRQLRPMRATELRGADRQVARELAGRRWPRLTTYEARAGRPAPIVRLERRAG